MRDETQIERLTDHIMKTELDKQVQEDTAPEDGKQHAQTSKFTYQQVNQLSLW